MISNPGYIFEQKSETVGQVSDQDDLRILDKYLETRSYLFGYGPTNLDTLVASQVKTNKAMNLAH